MTGVEGPGLHNDGVQYVYDDPVSPATAGSHMLRAINYVKNSATEARRDFTYLSNRDLLESTAMVWDPNSGSAVLKSKYEYGYDSLARRTHVTYSGTAFSQVEHDRWDYNDRNELIESDRYVGAYSAGTGTPGDPNLARDYQYDPIGNRQQYTKGAAATLYYCANQLNQYDDTGLDDDCDPAEETFGYDLDGNLDEDADFTYGWDAENRLVVVESKQKLSSDDKKVTFGYDYRNRRIWKKVFDWDPVGESWETTPSVHRKFVWHNWLMIAELDGSDDTVVRRYTWGLDLSGQYGAVNSIEEAGGIGGLLSIEDDKFDTTTRRFLLCYDGNGNVTQLLLRSDGGSWARYQVDVFGGSTLTIGSYANENPIRFSTKYHCEDTGLGYWGLRYYHSQAGRWLSRDGLAESAPDGPNRYSMVRNAPADRVDPDGAALHALSDRSFCTTDSLGLAGQFPCWAAVPQPPDTGSAASF